MSTRWQQIRSLAAEVRERFAQQCGQPISYPLDLDELADVLWSFSIVPTTTLGPGVFGKVEPELQTIRVRRDLPLEQQRFVAAHELGHIAIEGLAVDTIEDTQATIDERAAGDSADDSAVRSYNTRERREQEANLFALELLIPADGLWRAMGGSSCDIGGLAARFGVSLDAIRSQLVNVFCIEPPALAVSDGVTPSSALVPDPEQQAAIEAPLPLLLSAGPGTGKTRSIVAKYLSLIRSGVDPAHILALTFSNKAADEMRGRIIVAMQRERPDIAGRVAVNTFHAWGLNLLRTYGPRIGLPPDVQLRDTSDLYLLLKRNLAALELEHFKDLKEPARPLLKIIKAISRIKDELWTPDEYAALAEADAIRRVEDAQREYPRNTAEDTKKRDQAARQAAALREMARIYPCYETVLRNTGTLDYGDLIVLAVQALGDPDVAAEVRNEVQYILLDEFQDINFASGKLVSLLDGGREQVWAVGDAWQSVYRFRGASAANIAEFPTRFPRATVQYLTRNYRSLQPILEAGHMIMESGARIVDRPPLIAQRGSGPAATVVEWVAATKSDEAAGIAHDILLKVGERRVGGRRCAYLAKRRLRIRQHGRIRAIRSRVERRRTLRFGDHAVLCRTNDQVERVAEVLEAHGVPVDSVRDVYDTAEVKDVLAILAQVRANDSAGLLRALTMPEYHVAAGELNTLAIRAREAKKALARAVHDDDMLAELSPGAREKIERLHNVIQALAAPGDAWQVLTRYLFEYSDAMRIRLQRAVRDDGAARRELANLGRLLMTARTFARQAPPAERGAKYFVEYVRTLRAAGVSESQPVPGGADVVHVMTAHKAKGLEYPVVYVPHLEEGVFPKGDKAPPIPVPAGMIRDGLDDDVQQERYLLYVATTRARDRLILSRSLDGGRKQNGEPKVAQRSSLLPLCNDGTAPWPWVHIPAAATCPRYEPEVRLRETPPARMPLPATSIDLDGCLRRYLYQYVYVLYDDRTPYLRMHQAIRESVKQLAAMAATGEVPDEQEAQEVLHDQLQRYKLLDVLYAQDYAADAWQQVRSVWQDLKSGGIRPADVDTDVIIHRPVGSVAVRIDMRDQDEGVERWVWMRTGKRGDKDHLKERVILYALAQQELGKESAEIAIQYTASGAFQAATPKPKVLANHTAKLDVFLEAIQARRWEPKFGEHCATCPFHLVCPV